MTTTETRQSVNLEYGFDKSGGFFVLDHHRQMASYAYPTSDHADWAKRDPEHICFIMATGFDNPCPGFTRQMEIDHYNRVLRAAHPAT